LVGCGHVSGLLMRLCADRVPIEFLAPFNSQRQSLRRCAAKGIEVARVEIAKDEKIIAMIGNEQCEFACLALLSDILYDNVIQ
jgi:hypothetical protein